MSVAAAHGEFLHVLPKEMASRRYDGNSGAARVCPAFVELARRWDAGDCSAVQELEGTLELEAAPRENVKYPVNRPVNVSSIPQRIPFLYPGGKTWLTN